MMVTWLNFKDITIPGEISTLQDYVNILWTTVSEIVNENKITYDQTKEDPFLLQDMDKLVNRLLRAKENNEFVVVFWDYDVDGVSWTAVMKKWLQYLWFNNLDYIAPTRDTWYSIQRAYVYDYIDRTGYKPDLIVTVDCGIKSWHEIDLIYEELGIEVVVSDHHLPDESGYQSKFCIAMVDPHRSNSEYPFRPMSWSFVALKVIEALNQVIPFVSWPKDSRNPNWNPSFATNELQELATLWIVADMMPIIWENRLLVRECMPRYIFSKNKWIQTFTKNLINTNYENPKNIWPDLIGWQIWPRINAAKRIWNSTIPLDMLLSDNQEDINAWYIELNDMNSERKDLVIDEKIEAIEFAFNMKADWYRGLCYVKPEVWDGIIWLLAGQIKEASYLPTIVIGWYSEEKWILKWSCRSIEWFHILNALDSLSHYLLWYGWHSMAAWFGIKPENVDAFVSEFYQLCNDYVSDDMLSKKKETFGYIRNYSIINQSFFNVLTMSAPYGMWNPEPEFMVLWKIKYINYMGDGEKHVKITIENSNNDIVVWLAFNYNRTFINLPEDLELAIWKKVGLVWKLWLNEYNWKVTKQITLSDIAFI